jgi:hypothetical protein
MNYNTNIRWEKFKADCKANGFELPTMEMCDMNFSAGQRYLKHKGLAMEFRWCGDGSNLTKSVYWFTFPMDLDALEGYGVTNERVI